MKFTLKFAAVAILSLAAACGEKAAAPREKPAPAPSASDIESADAAETGVTEEAASAPCATIGADGYCGVAFGMTDNEASGAFPGGLFGEPFGDVDSEACYYKSARADDYSILFMFVDGLMERIDINARDIATQAGAKIGMSLDEVEALYPNSSREPNFYTAPAENLIVALEGGVMAIFEEDEGGAVTTFRIGRKPAIEYVEGCA